MRVLQISRYPPQQTHTNQCTYLESSSPVFGRGKVALQLFYLLHRLLPLRHSLTTTGKAVRKLQRDPHTTKRIPAVHFMTSSRFSSSSFIDRRSNTATASPRLPEVAS